MGRASCLHMECVTLPAQADPTSTFTYEHLSLTGILDNKSLLNKQVKETAGCSNL